MPILILSYTSSLSDEISLVMRPKHTVRAERRMADPLFVLTLPHSFSSVVSQMLGQHPQMYGLPELNLFVAETMLERTGVLRPKPVRSSGLLRAVAQLLTGEQTVESVQVARRWLQYRRDSAAVSVFQELATMVAPRILVEKSPATVSRPQYLFRVREAFPNAAFIHLLRHPRTQCESFWKHWRTGGLLAGRLDALDYCTTPPTLDFQKLWFSRHSNIVNFLEGVPDRQKMRVRSEDLLAEPDRHCRRIVEWMELRSDAEAIEAMKHPERSPYACFGPPSAPAGNDRDFLSSPVLRTVCRGDEPSLEGPLSWRMDRQGFSTEVKWLATKFGYA